MNDEPDICLDSFGAYLVWSPAYSTIVIIFSSVFLICVKRVARRNPYRDFPRRRPQETQPMTYVEPNDPNYRTMNDPDLAALPHDDHPDTFKQQAPKEPVNRYDKKYQTMADIPELISDRKRGEADKKSSSIPPDKDKGKVADPQDKIYRTLNAVPDIPKDPGAEEKKPPEKKVANPRDPHYRTLFELDELPMDDDSIPNQVAAIPPAKKQKVPMPINLAITEPDYHTEGEEEKSRPGRKETKF